MNKNYFIVDLYSDYKAFMEYKDLRELLIERIVDDVRSNKNELEIITNDFDLMTRLAEEKFTPLEFIIASLKDFGYKVIDLMELQRDLEDIKQFVGHDTVFDEIIKLIDKGE